MKCNASQKFPAACSACEKANERCGVDPSFKRISKRSPKVRQGGTNQTIYGKSHSVLSDTVSTESSYSLEDPSALESAFLPEITAELNAGGKRPARFVHEATGINLASSVVAEMLKEYYYKLHPSFPLLLDPVTVIDSYEKEPLLFWTVLTVASKDSETYADVNPRLQKLSMQLASDIIIVGNRSIYLVQALLLLCVWCSPHGSMSKEPLSVYCALAISMARNLGLHRPQHPFPLFSAMSSEVGNLKTRLSTWLACFIVDQWHTLRFGVPSSIRIDHTVLNALNDSIPELPRTMRIQLHIAVITSKISTALGECETSATGLTPDPLPFLRVFESELSMIQDRYANEWSPADEVSFLDARLNLYSYILGQERYSPRNCGPVNEFVIQSIVIARQLLNVVTTFPDILSEGIFHIFRSASYAVFFLLRIHGVEDRNLIDEVDIRNVIRQTFTLMKGISETHNDRRFQCMRICRIIEHMIDEDWGAEMPFTGKAESFMAINFVADVAARGIIKATGIQQHSNGKTEREIASGLSIAEGVPTKLDSNSDLDFLALDPMEWAVNWKKIDELLLSSDDAQELS